MQTAGGQSRYEAQAGEGESGQRWTVRTAARRLGTERATWPTQGNYSVVLTSPIDEGAYGTRDAG